MDSNKTILIIEDETEQQQLYKITLSRAGYHSVAKGDPASGLTWLEQVMPDLILLDIMLPQMSGLDMLDRIRGTANGRQIPIIIVTASTIAESVVEKYNVSAILRKPIMPNFLIERIKMALG